MVIAWIIATVLNIVNVIVVEIVVIVIIIFLTVNVIHVWFVWNVKTILKSVNASLIKYVQKHGKKVVAISTRNHIAKEIIEASDKFMWFNWFKRDWNLTS